MNVEKYEAAKISICNSIVLLEEMRKNANNAPAQMRNLSIAITHLEDALMRLNKAIYSV